MSSQSAVMSQLGGRRPLISSFILITTTFVTFNGGCWQLMRRRWKQRLMDNFDNMKKEALKEKELPFCDEKFQEFRRVEVDGLMDNEGTLLVGPRPMPSSKQALESSQESRRGGFLLMSPFEVEGTGQVVMVNRGWVPIEAYKSRLQRVQFTGEGFQRMRLKGVMRQEEWLSSTLGFDHEENHRPSQIGKYWSAMRPYDMAMDYFKRRWGDAEMVPRLKERHGAQHWFIEMTEDHSGEDQILIKGNAYPIRRTTEDLKRPTITPAVHLMYACFWFFVAAGCGYLLRRMWADVRTQSRMSKLASKAAEALAQKRNAEASTSADELKHFTDAVQKGRVSELRMSAMSPASGGAAASAEPKERQIGDVKIVQSESPYQSPKYVLADTPNAAESKSSKKRGKK